MACKDGLCRGFANSRKARQSKTEKGGKDGTGELNVGIFFPCFRNGILIGVGANL